MFRMLAAMPRKALVRKGAVRACFSKGEQALRLTLRHEAGRCIMPSHSIQF